MHASKYPFYFRAGLPKPQAEASPNPAAGQPAFVDCTAGNAPWILVSFIESHPLPRDWLAPFNQTNREEASDGNSPDDRYSPGQQELTGAIK